MNMQDAPGLGVGVDQENNRLFEMLERYSGRGDSDGREIDLEGDTIAPCHTGANQSPHPFDKPVNERQPLPVAVPGWIECALDGGGILARGGVRDSDAKPVFEALRVTV